VVSFYRIRKRTRLGEISQPEPRNKEGDCGGHQEGPVQRFGEEYCVGIRKEEKVVLKGTRSVVLKMEAICSSESLV
jgi:hypothetical protein